MGIFHRSISSNNSQLRNDVPGHAAYKLEIAKIRCVVLNVVPTNPQVRRGNAMNAIQDRILDLVTDAYNRKSDFFAPRHSQLAEEGCSRKIVERNFWHELVELKGSLKIAVNHDGLGVTGLTQQKYLVSFDPDDDTSTNDGTLREASVDVYNALTFSFQLQDLVELALQSAKTNEFLIPGYLFSEPLEKRKKYDLLASFRAGEYRPNGDVAAAVVTRRGRRVLPLEVKKYPDSTAWSKDPQP
jgi:hypothetical protein